MQEGVLVGNWGGKYRVPEEDDYMNQDIHDTVCQFLAAGKVQFHRLRY